MTVLLQFRQAQPIPPLPAELPDSVLTVLAVMAVAFLLALFLSGWRKRGF